jgi:hypothetical protein
MFEYSTRREPLRKRSSRQRRRPSEGSGTVAIDYVTASTDAACIAHGWVLACFFVGVLVVGVIRVLFFRVPDRDPGPK